jgi:hypothetical protein
VPGVDDRNLDSAKQQVIRGREPQQPAADDNGFHAARIVTVSFVTGMPVPRA